MASPAGFGGVLATIPIVGETGAWFPYGQSTTAFVQATRNVARGLCEGWHEIIRERPDARMMVSDTCEYHQPFTQTVGPLARAARGGVPLW